MDQSKRARKTNGVTSGSSEGTSNPAGKPTPYKPDPSIAADCNGVKEDHVNPNQLSESGKDVDGSMATEKSEEELIAEAAARLTVT